MNKRSISKSKTLFDNADETYIIKVKHKRCIISSLSSVFDEIKDLLTISFNEKGKFYFKILIHTDALNLNTNKKIIHIIKSPNYLVPSDSYKLDDIISL